MRKQPYKQKKQKDAKATIIKTLPSSKSLVDKKIHINVAKKTIKRIDCSSLFQTE